MELCHQTASKPTTRYTCFCELIPLFIYAALVLCGKQFLNYTLESCHACNRLPSATPVRRVSSRRPVLVATFQRCDVPARLGQCSCLTLRNVMWLRAVLSKLRSAFGRATCPPYRVAQRRSPLRVVGRGLLEVSAEGPRVPPLKIRGGGMSSRSSSRFRQAFQGSARTLWPSISSRSNAVEGRGAPLPVAGLEHGLGAFAASPAAISPSSTADATDQRISRTADDRLRQFLPAEPWFVVGSRALASWLRRIGSTARLLWGSPNGRSVAAVWVPTTTS